MSLSLSSDQTPPHSSRQKSGSACEECRRRKLQCDREKPQCGVCSEANIECKFPVVHQPRGPKKGHLRVLKTKIAELEQKLAEQQFGHSPSDQSINHPDGATFNSKEPPIPYSLPISEAETEDNSPVRYFGHNHHDSNFPSTKISDLMRADLDQSYFERAHMFTPMIHRSRYFAWAQQKTKSESQTCLQYAMWTLAASLSAPFQNIRHSLYNDTLKMLENLEMKETRTEGVDNDIEQAQAWILVAMYEFMRTNYRRGWMSLGRCFRLVQLMRLFEIDNSHGLSGRYDDTTDLVVIEVKRRTFWTAYVLDRFVSIRNEWPLTLNEQVVSTRLPIPEPEFQRNQFIPMPFLSEVVATSDHFIPSGFTECIVFATIWGRSISHRQQFNVESVYGGVSEKLWDWHQWLDNILSEKIKMLQQHYPSPLEVLDPMNLFTHMMAQTIIIYLFKIMESRPWTTEHILLEVMQHKQRAVAAAEQIGVLTKVLSQLSYFKVYPFTPIPLFLCAEFFITHEDPERSFDLPLREIMDALRSLGNVNNLAEDYLSLLKIQVDGGPKRSSRSSSGDAETGYMQC